MSLHARRATSRAIVLLGAAGIALSSFAEQAKRESRFIVEKPYLECLQSHEGTADLHTLAVAHPSASFKCLEDRSDASRADWTERELLIIGLALEFYYMDCGEAYPPGQSIRTLGEVLRPYLKDPPTIDGWGTELRYRTTPGRQWYELRSAGSDGVFEECGLAQRFEDTPLPPIVSNDFRTDIVYECLNFSAIPQLQLPAP